MRLALLCLCLVLAACAAPGVQPESPLWAVSPLPMRADRYRVALPLVEGQGWTAHCVALDTWGGSVPAQLATLPEWGCGHIWWSPNPLPDGLWPACRSVAECQRLDVAGILRARPGATFLLLNEPQNPDTAGGGWPVAPEVAARELRGVIADIRAWGGKAACCGLLMTPNDRSAANWWGRFVAAGGTKGLAATHYHIFADSATGAAQVKQRAEALFSGPLIVSESGFCRGVADFVRRIESPRYIAVFTLWSAGRCK